MKETQEYTAPQVEIIEVEVELGYQASSVGAKKFDVREESWGDD